jgi:hypothetical protein|tara:strand:+ start:2714 stop:3004 length:291 start_codon:yes stop_codon:yes gene_type:complete
MDSAKEIIRELNDISDQIRTIRDAQEVKPCSDDECFCNVFDTILDDIEEAVGQFREPLIDEIFNEKFVDDKPEHDDNNIAFLNSMSNEELIEYSWW